MPHSADPVLFGIRGENPGCYKSCRHDQGWNLSAFCRIQDEPGHGYAPASAANIAEIRDMHSYRFEGTVSGVPKTTLGGHVFFPIRDGKGDEIDCAAFEPTKNFRSLVRRLIPGDRVILSGSLSSGTLNIEKIEVKKLASLYAEENPKCPNCGKHMKSAGRGQGFRCKKCGKQAPSKTRCEVQRGIDVGLYEVPPPAPESTLQNR